MNLHFSLLPRWRGAAPVERAILAGDTETGVCSCASRRGWTPGRSTRRHRRRSMPTRRRASCARGSPRSGTRSARRACCRVVPETEPAPQAGEPTYAEKLTVDEFRLDRSRPALDRSRRPRREPPTGRLDGRRREAHQGLARPARAGRGEPGVVRRPGELVTTAGVLRLDEVQPEGKPRMTGQAWHGGPSRACAPGGGGRRVVTSRDRRSTRSSGSRTARTRTSCCPTLLRDVDSRRPRPSLRHGPRLRHAAAAARARLPRSSRRSTDRSSELDPPARAALRLGAYQLIAGRARRTRRWARRSPVAAPPRPRLRERGAARGGGHRPAMAVAGRRGRRRVGVRLSYPDWIVEELVADLGPADARASARGRQRAAAGHAARQPAARAPWTSWPTSCAPAASKSSRADCSRMALVAARDRRPGRASPAVAEGRATPQDQASQAVVARPRSAARRVGARRRRRARGQGDRDRRASGGPTGGSSPAICIPGASGLVTSGAATGSGSAGSVTRSSPTAGRSPSPACARRPGPGRRAVQRPRRAAPPRRGSLAHPARRSSRGSSTSSATCCAAQPAAVRPGGVARVLGVHAHRRRDHRRGRRGRAPSSRDSSPILRRARRGDRAGRGAVLLPHDAGTDGMYCPAVLTPRRRVMPMTGAKIAPSILSADFAQLADDVERVARRGRPAPRRRDGRALRAQPHDRARRS